MGEQRHTGDEPKVSMDMDEWVADDEPAVKEADSTIYQKDSINPAKRRRLEAMREEQELMRDLMDVFDDYDFDD